MPQQHGRQRGIRERVGEVLLGPEGTRRNQPHAQAAEPLTQQAQTATPVGPRFDGHTLIGATLLKLGRGSGHDGYLLRLLADGKAAEAPEWEPNNAWEASWKLDEQGNLHVTANGVTTSVSPKRAGIPRRYEARQDETPYSVYILSD